MAESNRPKVREAPYGYTLTLVPGARDGVSAFSQAIWSDEGELAATTKELVFLRTSLVNRCPT